MDWEKEGFKFKTIFIFLVAIAGLLFLASNMNLVSAACAEPCLAVSPDSFFFTAIQGGANPSSQNLTISEPILGGVRWTTTVTQPWLSVVPAMGAKSTSSTVVSVRASISGLAAGNYTGNIYVCDPNYVSSCDPSDPNFFDSGVSGTVNVLLTVTPPPAFCGDGTCNPPGENSTTCSQDCQTTCPNNIIESPEQCDPPALSSIQCPTSAKTCSGSCQCVTQCGNGVAEPGEQCDSADLGGQTCQSLNFTSGNLNCTASCTFDTSACTSPPPPCTLDSASWDITQTVEGNVVGFRVITTNCVGQAMSFAVRESDVWPLPDTPANINPANAVVASDGTATGTWTAEWINDGIAQGNPEYIFTATLVSNPGTNIGSSNQLEVLQFSPPLCNTVTTCAGYTNQTTCESDICSVASSSVPSTVDCNDPNTSCSCSWNAATTSCGPSVTVTTINVTTNQTSNIGTCYYTENTADTCADDGFLTVDLNATWIWDPGCDSSCQSNNQGFVASCQSTTETFQCPAQIPLPFFNVYNVLAAVVLIAIIYWIINLRKRKGKRNRKR